MNTEQLQTVKCREFQRMEANNDGSKNAGKLTATWTKPAQVWKEREGERGSCVVAVENLSVVMYT